MAKKLNKVKETPKVKRTYKKRTTEPLVGTTPVVRSVGVKFKDANPNWNSCGRIYNYLVDGLEIEVGDNVVVLTPSSGLTLVEVVSVSDKPEGTKYVVDKVDLAGHQARVDKQKLKEQLTKEIINRKNQIDENRILDLYAKEDKVFAGLLAQLRAI